jgi:hypothetical protein
MAGGRSSPASIRRFKANEYGETAVGDAAERGEAKGGGAESRGHRSLAGGEVLREKRWSPLMGRTRARWRRLSGPGERELDQEAHGVDAGGRRRAWRPESKIYSPELEMESANLPSIQGVLGRFLGRGGRGERGAAPGGHGSARGGQNRRSHGEVDAVVLHMCSSCTFPFSVCLNEEKGRWRRGQEGED